ncbi:MAG: hypothetical protein JWM87_798 [Candidatus Eremiobacteraeota bacterium]|nr:hypothetical protein [Candidatus Eremiobacteraeota bacterium]
MGQITITVAGSFGPTRTRTFSAMDHGHAHATTEALRFLANDVLPDANAMDHQYHAEGAAPPGGWPSRVFPETVGV